MNERIQELMKQSMVEYQFDMRFSPEKFAKLIIKDCLLQCYYRGMNDELYTGQLEAAHNIEQHFGVLDD